MNSQKRIDSFFKKSDSDTPKKKQCQEKDVKENEVPEASKSKPITKNPSFVSTGCSNFKLESLKSHARSTGHIQAQEAIRAKERPLHELQFLVT